MAPVQIGAAGRLSSGFDEREQAMSKLVDIDGTVKLTSAGYAPV